MAKNGCTWCIGYECTFNGTAAWEEAVRLARLRASEKRQKMYVRGFRKSVSHFGAWAYGTYTEPYPALDRDWSVYE